MKTKKTKKVVTKRLKREGSHKEPKLLEKTKVAVYECDLGDVILPAMKNEIDCRMKKEWAGSTKDDTDKFEDYKHAIQLYNRLVRAYQRLSHDKSVVEMPCLGILGFAKATQ